MDKQPQRRGIFFPILLVGLGVLFLLINLAVIPGTTRENLLLYWPLILVLAGLDGLWRREGVVWPLLLLGLGVLFQLGNLGYLPVQALPLLARIWPIILVAIGLDIAFGRNRGGWHTLLRVGLGLFVVAAIFWLAIAYPSISAGREVTFEQGLDGAKSSRVEISLPAGHLQLTAGETGGKLLTGTAIIPDNTSIQPEFTKLSSGEGQVNIELAGSGFHRAVNGWIQDYDLGIARDLPIDLKTNLAAGDLNLDLRGSAVRGVESQLAVGNQSITIPCIAGLTVEVKQAVGYIALYIPDSCPVRIDLDNALVNTSIPAGYQRNGDEITNYPTGSSGPPVEVRLGLAVGAVGIFEEK